MERQRARDGREQSRSVGSGDDHTGRVEGDRGEAAGVYLVDQDLIGGWEGGGTRRPGLSGERAVGARDQLCHQPGLPRAPGRGAGGPAVGFGQRAEQVQRDPVPGGAGHV